MSLSCGKCLFGGRSSTSGNCRLILAISALTNFQSVAMNAGDNVKGVCNAIPDIALNIGEDSMLGSSVLISARSGCVCVYFELGL